MKKAIGIVAVGMFALLFVTAQYSPVQAAGLSDSTIVSKLLSQLAGRNAAFRGVDACSKKGAVTLHGSVKTEELKSLAGDLAKQIDGVNDVVNNIVVK